MRIENLDWSKCQKQSLEVFCEKGCSLKCRKIHRKLLCQRNTCEYLFYRTTPDYCFKNAGLSITKREIYIVFVVESFIALAKIPDRKGSISSSSFYGDLLGY